MANKHAVLSASSSERWLNCPPSARLCENYEDKGSDYAAEGTDAHTLCEFRLKQALGMPTEDPIENLSWYNEEMEECAAGYATYVVELLETAKQICTDPVVMIEQRVNFSRWVQDGFGTADCIVIADGVMNICDYKHGKGVEVSAVANPQMMLYALGALEIFDDIYDIDTVRMTIFQPRKSNISVYEMEKADLLEWADTDLTQKAKLAYEGQGDFHCGEWCKGRYDQLLQARQKDNPGDEGQEGFDRALTAAVVKDSFDKFFYLKVLAVNPSNVEDCQENPSSLLRKLFTYRTIEAERNLDESENKNDHPLAGMMNQVFNPEEQELESAFSPIISELNRYVDDVGFSAQERIDALMNQIIAGMIHFGWIHYNIFFALRFHI